MREVLSELLALLVGLLSLLPVLLLPVLLLIELLA